MSVYPTTTKFRATQYVPEPGDAFRPIQLDCGHLRDDREKMIHFKELYRDGKPTGLARCSLCHDKLRTQVLIKCRYSKTARGKQFPRINQQPLIRHAEGVHQREKTKTKKVPGF